MWGGDLPHIGPNPWIHDVMSDGKTTDRGYRIMFHDETALGARQPVSPLQGFGQCWQKTFKVRLSGVNQTPAEVMKTWKENFPKFQPRENYFYPSMLGIKPGEVLLIEAKVPPLPGMPSFLPVATGVMVLYADDTSFTVMTPEGHPESGWNTFSVYEEDDGLVAQAQSLCRPTDPLYEVFNRYLGSSAQQDRIWSHVLSSLAEYYGIKGQVTLTKVMVSSGSGS